MGGGEGRGGETGVSVLSGPGEGSGGEEGVLGLGGFVMLSVLRVADHGELLSEIGLLRGVEDS